MVKKMAEIQKTDKEVVDGIIYSKANQHQPPPAKAEKKTITTTTTTDINHNNEEKSEPKEAGGDEEDQESSTGDSPPVFQPRVSLPLVTIDTLECDEDVVVELRARLYRLDTSPDLEDGPEFKERGTGIVKILRHKESKKHRILMRRDKTLKICANHYITSNMKLSAHNNSEKVFIYFTVADYYDGEANPETFAIRFGTAEKAKIFKEAFENAAKKDVPADDTDKLVDELEKIKIEPNNNHVTEDKKKKDQLIN